jgi:putative PEP-CTERM system histidine kinase
VALGHLALAVTLWRLGTNASAGPLPQTGAAFDAGHARIKSVRRWVFVALWASTLWGAVGLAATASTSPAWLYAYALLDLSRYAAWYAVLVCLLVPASGDRIVKGLGYGPARVALMALLVNVPLLLLGPWVGSLPGWLGSALPLMSLALPLVGLMLLEQLLRTAGSDALWHTKPMVIGLGLIFVFDVVLHSQPLLTGTVDRDMAAARAGVHALSMPLLLLASRRNALWLAPLGISRGVVFFSATLMLASIYLFVIAGLGVYMRHVDERWGRALAVLLVAVAVVALAWTLGSSALRAKVQVALSKNLFRYRYDYRREWLKLTSTLAEGSAPETQGVAMIRGLAGLLHAGSGQWWMLDDQGGATLSAVWNLTTPTTTVPTAEAFRVAMAEREWIFDLDACRRAPQAPDAVTVPPAILQDTRLWLLVPLLVGQGLKGFVALGRPSTAIDINWETRDLMRTAGRQAGAFMALGQASEALAEARKFEAFNRMSAFVVHDIKNIVAQQSLMVQNARRLKDNPDFQADMLATVENSVERMNRLLAQLREGATPVGVVQSVRLDPLLRRLQQRALDRGRTVRIEQLEPISTLGHSERVERVLGHLVDNALDASDNASADVSEVVVRASRVGEAAVIVVEDQGRGMSEAFVKHELFKPFVTTKSGGMGIGAFESRQYVQELGGSLDVHSMLGQGTTVTVRLPLFHEGVA